MSKSVGLATRDLISVGIFAALFFVITFVSGMVGFAGPQFMFIGWLIGIVANGVVLALYAARTPKLGAFTLLGLINGFAFMLTGHYFWTLLGCTVLGFIADLILTKSALGIDRAFPLAYGVFCMWIATPFVPLVLDADSYYQDISSQMGPEYAEAMSQIFLPWVIGIMAIGFLLVGIFAGIIGVRAGKKNFEGAGLL